MGSSRYDIIKGSTIEQEARTIIEVYTDGASNGNPGISGAGVYIKANGKDYEYALPLEEMSNHEAEFHAIIHALSEEHTSELQSRGHLVCRLLLETKK